MNFHHFLAQHSMAAKLRLLAAANLDQMTQQNAALVEESGAAASSLREQAFVLKDSVNRFKLA